MSLDCYNLVLSSGSLTCWFSLPGTLFSQLIMWLLPSSHAGLITNNISLKMFPLTHSSLSLQPYFQSICNSLRWFHLFISIWLWLLSYFHTSECKFYEGPLSTLFNSIYLGFPGSSAGKESACDVGDTGLIPRLGRSVGEGIGYPLSYSWASLVAQLVKNPPVMQDT